MTKPRIVCATDLSPRSDRAVAYAVLLAERFGGALSFLHVFSAPITLRSYTSFVAPDAVATLPTADDQRAELERVVQAARAKGLEAVALFVEGDPVSAIEREAAGADLLVLGTRGRTGFERIVLGSVFERVIRQAECPVLVAAQDAAVRTPTAILCPIDFSDSADIALALASRYATRAGATLTLLHILPKPDDQLPAERHFAVPEYERLLERNAEQALQTLAARHGAKDAVIGHGKPYREILRFADDRGIDLIVMGIHGRAPLERALFGSNTNHVIRQSRCPVVTVKTGPGHQR